MAQTTSNDVFRPSSIADVPELSKDNLLSMLNQIPDLKGRQFKIEYASSGAPESYPLPFHLDSTTNSNYPEPVVIDKLPTNVIQHVKTSHNSALVAAFDAAIAQEQNSSQSTTRQTHLNNSTGTTTFHHTAANRGQVHESRPVSSSSSSSSSDDESETDSDESELAALARA